MKKYIKIADTIAMRIKDGLYTPQTGLPTHRELCSEFMTSRSNLHKVMNLLEERRLIERCRGQRTKIKAREKRTLLFLFFSSIKGHLIDRSGISARLYHGIHRFAEEYNLTLLVQSGENFIRSGCSFGAQIDGIIAGGVNVDKYLPLLQETGAQIVALGSYHQLDLDVFCADYDEAGYRAAASILRRNLKRPLFLMLQFEDEDFLMTSFAKSRNAFQEKLLLHRKITVFHHTVHYKDLAAPGKTVLELFRKIRENNVDSIVYCVNIPYQPLRRFTTGRTLPSVVIDRQMEMDDSDPSMELIDFASERIGYLAARRLYKRMQNPALEPLRILIPCSRTPEQEPQYSNNGDIEQ